MKVEKSNWKKCHLGDICTNGSSNITISKTEIGKGEYLLFGASGIVGNIDFYHQDKEYIGIVKDGSGVGRVNKFPSKSSLVGTMQYIFPKDNVSIDFLKHLLISLNLAKYVKGAAIPHIYFRHYKLEKILVPTIAEQESIASELDALQEVIDGYREQIADLDALAQSIFLDTFGDPITNPKVWEIKRLDDVCDSQLGKMINQQTQTGELKPFLCAVNVLDNDFYVGGIKKFRIKTDEEEKYRVLPGDLMICEGGDAGRCAIWNKDFEIYYQKSVHRVRSSQLSMQYLMFVLRIYKQQGVLAEKSKGATIQHLTKKSLNQLLIMFPPITLQNSFSEQFTAIEDKKELIRQQLADAEMLMAERMQYYFS